MQKEILTKENIKKDLKSYAFREIIGILLGGSILWILFALINFSLGNSITIFNILTAIFLLSIIFCLSYVLIIYIPMNKNKFSIRCDTLVEKRYRRTGYTTWRTYLPYRLTFNNGYFDIPAQSIYKWSSIHSMNEKQIYETSAIGDTFIVVEFNKKIIVAYNANFFEFQVTKSYPNQTI